ncbi:glycosyltransferase [Eggerthella guodeyinii]|uniref:Glycosyltransferase n=1 Tax=Eggerthella guodeyinii TaxID=2690837 RepID=A0A6L7IVP3_9ACTN|nr:glycosyltransferase [Eggerthella guodeyinii]QOS68989.1 glycosyltransferase [Eggerthella guodeyinii]
MKPLRAAIVAVCDFDVNPMGGEVSLLRNLLSGSTGDPSTEYSLIGLSFNGEETGCWQEKVISGSNYNWLPVASISQNLSRFVPLRLRMALGLRKHSKQISERNFDIVYFHSAELFSPLRCLNVPLVYHVHGNPYYTVRMSRFPLLRTRPFTLFYDTVIESALKGSDRIIWAACRSKDEYFDLVPHLKPTLEDKIDIVHSSFDAMLDLIQEETLDSRFKYIITVGRLSRIKHIDFILEVFASIQKIRTDIRMLVCGSGEEEDALKEKANILGCGKSVTFFGNVDKHRLASYLNQSRVFLFASESEALSLVVLESLHMGTPVVSTSVGDVPLVIENEYVGSIVEGWDEKEFVQKAIHYLDAGEEELKTIRSACGKAASRYTPERMASEINKVLHSTYDASHKVQDADNK